MRSYSHSNYNLNLGKILTKFATVGGLIRFAHSGMEPTVPAWAVSTAASIRVLTVSSSRAGTKIPTRITAIESSTPDLAAIYFPTNHRLHLLRTLPCLLSSPTRHVTRFAFFAHQSASRLGHLTSVSDMMGFTEYFLTRLRVAVDNTRPTIYLN